MLMIGPVDGLRKRETWGMRALKGPDKIVDGWFINLGVTGIRARILQNRPSEFEVAYVFEGSPAAGQILVGDRIVGVEGKRFKHAHKFGYGMDFFGYQGPMMALGEALESAQGQQSGKLSLSVVRESETKEVSLMLRGDYGAFSSTYPYVCKKSQKILQECYAYLLKQQHQQGWWSARPHVNAFATMALMGSDDKRHREAVSQSVRYMAQQTTSKISFDGLQTWKYSLYGITLAEYYLLTQEPWLKPELEEIYQWLAKAQTAEGGWGHKPADSPGGNGYGAINVITAQAMTAMVLMQLCEINVDQQKVLAAQKFIKRGTNSIAYVWYKDRESEREGYADMGRTGASSIAHRIAGVREVAIANAQCIGEHPMTLPDTHGSPLLGMAWTALGALSDEQSFRKLMDHNRWYFALAHCHDGTFYYQPNRDNNAQDFYSGSRLSATATNAFILSAKYRRLRVTGK